MSFATYFEWEIKAGAETAFADAWEAATRHLLDHGSSGSALFRTDDGHFAAFARWPSRTARDSAFSAAIFPASAAAMSESVERMVHRIDLEGERDLWAWPPS